MWIFHWRTLTSDNSSINQSVLFRNSSPSMWYLRGVAVHKHPVHYCRHIYCIPCIFICKYSTSKTFLFTAEHDIPRASSLMVQILQHQLIPCFRSRLNFLLKFSENSLLIPLKINTIMFVKENSQGVTWKTKKIFLKYWN